MYKLNLLKVSKHLILSKMVIRHLVHTKWSLIFGPVKNHLAGPNKPTDILDRTVFQGPFSVDQVFYGCFGHCQVSCKSS